jgi:hypothetical protein
MNAISTFEPSVATQVMIINARNEYGISNPISFGAVALADWLNDPENAETQHGLIVALGGHNSVMRMVADVTLPGREFSELLGSFSAGEIRSSLWLRRYPGKISYRPLHSSTEVPASEEVRQHLEAGDTGERMGAVESPWPSIGAIGTIPPGPLFRFRAVEDEPNLRQIVGFGLAIECSDAALCALRDAAIAAIADIRGGAQA